MNSTTGRVVTHSGALVTTWSARCPRHCCPTTSLNDMTYSDCTHLQSLTFTITHKASFLRSWNFQSVSCEISLCPPTLGRQSSFAGRPCHRSAYHWAKKTKQHNKILLLYFLDNMIKEQCMQDDLNLDWFQPSSWSLLSMKLIPYTSWTKSFQA